MLDRFVKALVRNCALYTGGPKAFDNFSARNRRIWDMVHAAGLGDAVTRGVVPPLRAGYPRWAAECDRAAK